jgi:hypothetical protein
MEYTAANGDVFRKAFEAKPGQRPITPAEGTHNQLNDLRQQW